MNIKLLRNPCLMTALCIAGSVLPGSATTISVTIGGTAACSVPNSGLCTLKGGATTLTFDMLNGTLLPYTEPGLATYTVSAGVGSPFVTGSASGEWATPANDTTPYLTIGSPNRPSAVTILLLNPITYFGMYLGSPDTYNRIEFYSGVSLVQGYQGNDLINPADGAWSRGEYINFDISGGTVDRIVMSSTSPAMETDNHAFVSAVPEPMSTGCVGFGLLVGGGFVRRFRG